MKSLREVLMENEIVLFALQQAKVNKDLVASHGRQMGDESFLEQVAVGIEFFQRHFEGGQNGG